MKSSLYLTVIFILCLIAFILLGAFSYMLYIDCINLSAGSEVSFFNFIYFLHGLVYSIPAASVLSCFFLIFYMIRHLSNPWLNLAVYSVLGILVWIVIIPLSYKLSDYVVRSTSETIENLENKNFYTSGYFRQVSNGYVYFTQVHSDNTVDGVIIVKGNASTFEDIPLSSFFDNINKDSLFESSVKPTGVVNYIISFLKMFWEIGKYSYMGKGLYLLSLFSFSLALLSVIGLARCSIWRLCNMCTVFVAFLLLCFINLQIYDSKFFVTIIKFFIDKDFDFLSDRRILQLIINSVFFVGFTTIGIINVIRKPEANQEINE